MTLLADPAVLVALALLSAIVGGYLATLFHVPRVVGYLVGGLVLRWGLSAGLPGDGASTATFLSELVGVVGGIKTLALGLILFTLGSVFEARHLRSVGRRDLGVSVIETMTVWVLVGCGGTLVWWLAAGESVGIALSAGVLLGIVAIATAPAATVLVLQEYDAKGPVSDTLLTLTAMNNTLCVVLFHVAVLVLGACGLIESANGTERWLWLDLFCASAGSVLLGVVLGLMFSVLYARLATAEFLLVFLAVMLSLGAFEQLMAQALHLSFNFLLTSLFIGATFANITADQQRLHATLSVLARPVYACFFVLAGFELHVSDLASLGLLGAVYVVLRASGKGLGGWIASRRVGHPSEVPAYIGLGLLCQAGVAIGLVDALSRMWGTTGPDGFVPHAVAAHLKTVVLGSVVVFELLGPMVLKAVAIRSGEVKAITLVRHEDHAGGRRALSARSSVQALFRLLRPRRAGRSTDADRLCVRDIMRTNVRYLRASSRLDELLHHVERSRDDQFPVVGDDGFLIGMVHFGDLRDILYDPVLRELVTAHDLARPDTPDIVPDMPLKALFGAFQQADVGTLPVVEEAGSRRVVGIVEQRDMLRLLHKLDAL